MTDKRYLIADVSGQDVTYSIGYSHDHNSSRIRFTYTFSREPSAGSRRATNTNSAHLSLNGSNTYTARLGRAGSTDRDPYLEPRAAFTVRNFTVYSDSFFLILA